MLRPKSLPGILLVAYGVTSKQGRQALEAFTGKVRSAFPGFPAHWAFTMRHPARGTAIPEEKDTGIHAGLSLLRGQGASHIAVQPLHITHGSEHAGLAVRVNAWRKANPDVAVAMGRPLLHSQTAMLRVIETLASTRPPSPRPDETPVWIGHGNSSPGHNEYARMAAMAAGHVPPVIMGCVSGRPDMNEVIAALNEAGAARVCLMPFFALSGHHAASDVGGKGDTSWRTRLEKNGFTCRAVSRGLVEYETFAAMWIDHLRDALTNLEKTSGCRT